MMRLTDKISSLATVGTIVVRNRSVFSVNLNTMMQWTANENAAGLRRICKSSDKPKTEGLQKTDVRLILHRTLNETTT